LSYAPVRTHARAPWIAFLLVPLLALVGLLVPAGPATAEPDYGITVTPTTGLTDGDTIEITGTFPATITSNVGPNTGTDLVTGLYVMYCDTPTAPVGTPGGRLTGDACDSTHQLSLASGPGTMGGTPTGTVTDGTWTFTVPFTVDATTERGIFVRLYHGFNPGNLTNPYLYDQYVALEYAPGTDDPDTGDDDTDEPGTDEPEVTTPPAKTAGSLSWGISAPFRAYITGPIAGGSITTTGVTTSGSSFVFPQAGAAKLSDGTGTASFSGTVRFTGHHGALDQRLSDPQVRIDSATSGTLLARVNGGARVAFAKLALASGTKRTDASGAIRYTGVPATLTAAGADFFRGEYTTADPVSFVIGAAGATTAGTVVVASAPAPRTPAAAPPATTGITTTGELVEGGEITADADGFESGETGILAVIYSEPTVLSRELTADAAGHVRWTGALPTGLTGSHTLTFQGSVDRGAVLDIAAAITLPCTVSDASLVWGFKESFRAYIDGSIANGEWTTDGSISYDTPAFTWTGGAGGTDEDGALDVQFSGSIRFTGHEGILDTTVANPRVVIDGDRAVLLLDVHGTTQAGEPVEQAAVEFGTLDLAGVTATRDGDTVTWADIPAVLTEDGAAAFGTYPAGDALDPLTITATVGDGCGEAAPAEPSAEPGTDVEPEPAAAGWPLWATVLIALLALALVAAVTIVLVRRRRA